MYVCVCVCVHNPSAGIHFDLFGFSTHFSKWSSYIDGFLVNLLGGCRLHLCIFIATFTCIQCMRLPCIQPRHVKHIVKMTRVQRNSTAKDHTHKHWPWPYTHRKMFNAHGVHRNNAAELIVKYRILYHFSCSNRSFIRTYAQFIQL